MARSLPTAAQILDRFYAAERIYMSVPPSERDFSGMAACISPSIQLHQSPDLPYGGKYVGHEGFLQWSEEMSARFDTVDVMEPRVLESAGGDGDEVVVLSTLRLKVRATGEELVNPFAQIVTVDRSKGVITELRPMYWNVKGLNEALGGGNA